jgi:acetyl-CoA carboxylase biotin carboxyl carrier protein
LAADLSEKHLDSDIAPEDLRALFEMVAGSDLEELEVEHDGLFIRLRRDPSKGQPGAVLVSENGLVVSEGASVEPNTHQVVTSPWVGVFYAAVQPGEVVAVGQSIGSVEALRMQHPVESEAVGIVEDVLVHDGHPVEYGQPLVRLRPEA